MSDWREQKLGDLVAVAGGYIRTGPFGSQLHASDYTEDPDGIPVVMPKSMIRGTVDPLNISRVNQTTAERLKQHRLVSGDVVLARRGDVGRFAFISDDEVGWICGTGSMRVHVPDRSVIQPMFLRYAVSHPSVTDWLAGHAVGATMPNLNASIVAGLPLRVPDSLTQRRIAAVLSAFDELIEINERRIALLEDLARSLYQEWFVHFRFPGHGDVEFVDSELGPIPEGWEVRRVNDVVTLLSRGISPKYTEKGRSLVINQRCIRAQRVNTAAARRNDRPVPAAKEVQFGDVLLNSTGVGTLGRVAVFLEQSGVSVTADSHVTIVRPRSEREKAWFGLHMLSRQQEFEAMGTGSTGQTELGRQALGERVLLLPPERLLDTFSEVAWPVLGAAPELIRQRNALVATRDLLLPRLVTGRLDISDIDLGDLLLADAT
jgi:type I restriction enzyme S subunit